MTKLIEVALPVEAISAASRRDKDRKVGTIKNVHKWFAPMPTPAWRALLFAAIVDDPGDEAGRAKLIRLIERLVPEDGGAPPDDVLEEAKRLISEATGGDIPTVLDPFCGGGSTLVEAQRLGLPAVGSDLNPVPALITRVLIDLIPQVASRPPLVGDPDQLGRMAGGQLDGFFADLRHYAERVRARAWGEAGHLYTSPSEGTVVAWLWAHTVTCPNPVCRASAPLVSSFWLSKKKGAATWIEPVVLPDRSGVRFEVRSGSGEPPPPTKLGRGGSFRCSICSATISEAHVKAEGVRDGLGLQVMAIAVDEGGSRVFFAPIPFEGGMHEPDRPAYGLDVDLPDYARWFSSPAYGLTTVADLFTDRQLVTLGAFADAVADVAGWVLADGGDGPYARAVASVLGLCVGKLAQTNSRQSRWYIDNRNGSTTVQAAFGRHALPMVWDFAEVNPFGDSVGNWTGQVESAMGGLTALPKMTSKGVAISADARSAPGALEGPALIATDPPYFAHIGYADLSDYFYVWHRRALREVHPDLYSTVATPKDDELIAAVHRHGGDSAEAARFFVEGFTEAFRVLSAAQRADLPLLIVYAHRQEESSNGSETATAWDAMLAAILDAGLGIAGTWPIHATSSSRQIGQGTNALASYVVLVCRPRATDARPGDRQGFLGALRVELPRAIKRLQETAISAIDLGQATIGPGMAVFSRFSRVIETDGSAMSVRAALDLIGQVRAEVLDEFVGDPGNETRWAMTWFRDNGFAEAPFDEAEKLFRNTSTSLEGLERSGIVRSARGRVRLLSWEELPGDWDPTQDRWRSVWETALHLVKRLRGGGEAAASALLRQVPDDGDSVRELAYWIVDKCQFTQAKEVGAFDELITSWPRITELAASGDQDELTLLS